MLLTGFYILSLIHFPIVAPLPRLHILSLTQLSFITILSSSMYRYYQPSSIKDFDHNPVISCKLLFRSPAHTPLATMRVCIFNWPLILLESVFILVYRCSPTGFKTPLPATIYHFSHQFLFFASSSLFFSPSTLTSRFGRLVLYTTTLNDETLSFSSGCPSVLPWLTRAFCIIPPFFRWSNGMATDIGFLVSGLDVHILRFKIGRKGLRKTGKPFQCFFQGTLTFPL
jgi:hypothetical protein